MELVREVELLKKFKEEEDWSYSQLAKAIGTSKVSMVHWLTGKVKPNPLSRRAIKSFLLDHYRL